MSFIPSLKRLGFSDMEDKNGKTPILLAAKKRQLKTILELIESGAIDNLENACEFLFQISTYPKLALVRLQYLVDLTVEKHPKIFDTQNNGVTLLYSIINRLNFDTNDDKALANYLIYQIRVNLDVKNDTDGKTVRELLGSRNVDLS
jgi:ankyrin repeat protein